MTSLSIAEAAARTGLTAHTPRYHERDGLMLAGVGNEVERVETQLAQISAHLRAIDHRIGIYEGQVDPTG